MRPDEPCAHERDATGPLGRFFFVTGLACTECEREAYEAWLDTVRDKLAAGLAAVAAGEPFNWAAPEHDGPRFALVRLDDKIDLALSVGDDGRCTIPVAGRWSFPRVATLKETADAERRELVLKRLRHGVMTIEQAKRMLTRRAYG